MGINGPLFYYFLPIFLGLIAWEVRQGRKRGLTLYTRDATFASIVIGVVQRFIGLIPLSIAGIVSVIAYEHRLYTVPLDDWRSWALLFILLEFTYYWFHRWSHEVRWFWTTHAVHHSIEELNILAAYRLGWTSKLSAGSIVHAPLMLLGFSPAAVFTMLALNLFYQSWLHTVLIGKLGPLEGVLNTPSAHRVHHARNADYLDRNYGGVTVIFDRLFGTYVAERETEPCEYGLVKPVGSQNPIVIAFHEWARMFADLRRSHPRHWFGYMFGPPGWAPDGQSVTSADIRARYRASRRQKADDNAPAATAPAEA